MKIFNLFGLFTKHQNKSINISKLPSQGYFYPMGLKLDIERGTKEDKEYYLNNLNNTNVLGFTEIVKNILKSRVNINLESFKFDSIKTIDIFYMFILFIEHTENRKIKFNEIVFNSDNFIYFDFEKYHENYDSTRREFKFNGWRFSLPSVGIESSLNRFSYEITIRGELEKYQNSNFNLIFFLGDRNSLTYEEIINIVEIMEDLYTDDLNYINEIVSKFTSVGVYLLISEGKDPVRVSSNMVKEIWSK